MTLPADRLTELAAEMSKRGLIVDDIPILAGLIQDFDDQLADNWDKIKAAAVENFRNDEDAGSPTPKATFNFEVDMTDRARPKLTTKMSWSVKYACEREHQLDDPRQGKLEYVPVSKDP